MLSKHTKEDVTVIIPTKGINRFLQQCIKSVIDQDYTGMIKIIIVNDNPALKFSCTSKFKRRLILCINNSKKQGPSESRNVGMKYARGIYVAFLDSDDYWERGFVTTCSRVIHETNAAGTLCMSKKIYENFSVLRMFRSNIKDFLFIFNAVRNNSKLPQDLPFLAQLSHMLFQKESIENISFDSKFVFCEDWDFVSRILERKNIVLVKSKLTNFRFSKSSYTEDIRIRRLKSKSYDDLYKKLKKVRKSTANTFIFRLYKELISISSQFRSASYK